MRVCFVMIFDVQYERFVPSAEITCLVTRIKTKVTVVDCHFAWQRVSKNSLS